jgi:hypothetical protein
VWGHPDDIYTGMTLSEFDIYVRGHMKRMETNQELLAWHAANLMNCWTKKKVTADKLLGRKETANPQSFEELRATMQQQQAKAERSLIAELSAVDGEIVYPDEDQEIDLSFALEGPGDTLSDED